MSDSVALTNLFHQIRAGRAPDGWPAGKAFEFLVLRAFELEGAEVRWPYEVKLDGEVIEQIDGAIHADGASWLVEAKDQRSPVNVEPIAKLRNQLLRRPAAARGLVFSTSGFTEPAKTLCRFISPRRVVEEGFPDYDFRVELVR